MRKFLLLCFVFFTFVLDVNAENIHFNDSIYKLTDVDLNGKVVENEYYIDGENSNLWTSKVEITYLPEVSNPLKYASEVDKKVSSSEKQLLLKFVQNKKIDIAVLTYLESDIKGDCACFIYNVLKYEKHPDKGIMALRFAKKYKVDCDSDIQKVANEVKTINDDYIQRIIISPIPPIVKEIK